MKKYEEAMKKLFPREKNFVRNTLLANQVEDMSVLGPFVHTSLKRSSISQSNFKNIMLKYSAWSESHFFKVEFKNCNLTGVNMQLCVFEHCSFTDESILNNVSFCNSLFKNTVFINIVFRNCILTDAKFISCKFINCKFQSSSFDGTKFVFCDFEHLIARNMNLDYSQYRNCNFYNSELSLFQIGYTIGMLQGVSSQSDNMFAFQGQTIPSERFYSEYIEYLIEYFTSREDLFPLSNLLLFLGGENAKQCIMRGIKEAINKQKYRLVLHFCELINYYNCLNSSEKRDIISFLNTSISTFALNENISESIKYSVLIEHYLLDQYDNVPHCYISIETDYTVDTSNSISNLITELDDILVYEQGQFGEHNITITHNSPLWLDIILAVGGSIVASYIKEKLLDRLIDKIRQLFKNKKIKMKKITIKKPDVEGSEIIEVTDDDE